LYDPAYSFANVYLYRPLGLYVMVLEGNFSLYIASRMLLSTPQSTSEHPTYDVQYTVYNKALSGWILRLELNFNNLTSVVCFYVLYITHTCH